MKKQEIPVLTLNKNKKQFRNYFLAILAFTFLLYGNSIKNGYSLDDNYVTVTTPATPNNPRIEKGIRGIPKLFTTHYIESASQSFEYRPLVLVTFAIEYQFFGSNPHISHFFSVLIYALTCMLLFSILCRLLKNYNVIFPLLITFLFIVHPIHTEVVDNIKCRDELLSFLFGICSLHSFLKNTETKEWRFIVAGILFLFMSLLCKRTAVLFLALIPLTIYFFTAIKLKRILLMSFFPLLAFLFYRILVKTLIQSLPVLRDLAFFENPLYFEHGFLTRIPMAFYTMGYYIKLLVFPYPLCCYYGYNTVPVTGLGSPTVVVSAIFYFAIAIYALVKIPEKNIFSYGILIYLAGVFPFANLVTPVVGIVGERFIYLASLGFCLAAAYLLLNAFKVDYKNSAIGIKVFKPSFIKFLLVLFFIYSTVTIARNNKWKDFLTLFRNDVEHFQNSCQLHHLTANEVYPEIFKTPAGAKKDALIQEATFHFKQEMQLLKEGVEKYPEDCLTLNNIGIIYVNIFNDPVSAQPFFKKSMTLKPDFPIAPYNFASCYEKRNLPDSAIMFYEKMVAANTKYTPVYIQLHELYVRKHEYLKAIACDEKGIKQVPAETKLYIILGNALLLNKDTVNGIKQFEKAIELEPGNANLQAKVAAFLKATGYTDKGQKLIQN